MGENKAGTTRFSCRNSAGFRVSARLAGRLYFHPISSHHPIIQKTPFRKNEFDLIFKNRRYIPSHKKEPHPAIWHWSKIQASFCHIALLLESNILNMIVVESQLRTYVFGPSVHVYGECCYRYTMGADAKPRLRRTRVKVLAQFSE